MTTSINDKVANTQGDLVRASTNPVTGGISLSTGGVTVPVAYVLKQSAVPVILAPNGTVATNGTITLGTALPTTYSGGAWVRLPAGAVSGGLAGLYWTVFSSTTVGAVKTNFVDVATAFTPYIPSGTLVAETGSNAAYTQTSASDITLANITVAGGLMGPNGALRVSPKSSWANNANAKTVKVLLSNFAVASYSVPSTLTSSPILDVRNRGSQSLQIGFATATDRNFGVVAAYSYGAIDTGANQPLTFTGQLAVATDYIVLEGFTVEVLPA